MKYINISLLVIIVILLIILTIKLVKLMKTIANTKEHSQIINKDLIDIKDAKREIEDSSNSWALLLLITTIYKVIKETRKDYKNNKKGNRNMPKSFVKTCIKNAHRISMIRL